MKNFMFFHPAADSPDNEISNDLRAEISERIDREIQNELNRDLEIGIPDSEIEIEQSPQEPGSHEPLIDVEDDNDSDDEDSIHRYTPPPPPFPQRSPPDPSRFNSTSSRGPSLQNLQNPVIEAVRNILNSPPDGQFSFGPTGITGSFNMNGGTGMGTVETAIFNNIMSNNIENVRFDPSNNQVHFETTL